MNFNKKPYKIEVWEDKWNPVSKNSDFPQEVIERGGYWTEVRSVRIGDSEADFFGKAFNPELIRETTGEVIFSFSIYGYYFEEGEKVSNFLAPFIFNETKIKLFYDDKWYDFVVKEMKESHSSKGLIYEVICKFLPMVELSKNGWELGFSLDQENCIGTIDYFTDIILKDTDWTYQPNIKCDLTEYNLEYLYGVTLNRAIQVQNIVDFNNPESHRVNLVAGSTVFVFFNEKDKIGTNDLLQVLITDLNTAPKENAYTLQKGLPNYKISGAALNKALDNTSCYGYRVIESNRTVWEPELSQYVTVYTHSSKEEVYYAYNTTEIKIDYSNLNNTNPDLTATTETVTKFYKKIDGEIYKLEVLGGYGKPTISGVPKQYYIDTQSNSDNHFLDDKFDVYVYEGSNWILKNDLDSQDYPIGTKQIVYYTKEEIPGYNPDVLPNAEKQRSLIEEKSNRFNLLQKVAEIFEVWVDFEIEHDADGRISLGDNYLPKKYITFKTEFGKNNYAGFSYDINLSDIERIIDSENLATKMYVEKVDNENADDGICSIQTADFNIGGELFLINLDYYAQIGLINYNKLLKDLYGTTSDDFSYLTKLGAENKRYTEITNQLDGEDGYKIQLAENEEFVLFYNDAISAAESEYQVLVNNYNNNKLTYDEKLNYNSLKTQLENNIAENRKNLDIVKKKAKVLAEKIKTLEETLEEIEERKFALNRQFYNMYSRFLQEGTWQGNDYIDPNAYYYDANQVLLESSRPSIQYNIKVYDISTAKDYLNEDNYRYYNYELGDITYVEDVEFFGRDEKGTPYREKVIISSIKNYLDKPWADEITVKNYKTRFEDLFQRTTATVQSYNLNKNIYNRAAAIEATGEISYSNLQTTLQNNSFILSQSKTNSVITDSSGIEVMNLDNYRERVKIVAGGVFVSNDGGITWNSGITGSGINTALLNAGRIDAEKINIMSGSYPTFAWDKYGINAFSWENIHNNSYGAYNSFIRFDQFGFYGIRNSLFNLEKPFNPAQTYDNAGNVLEDLHNIDQIIENINKYANFSLTWDGFYLRTNEGSVQIDSKDDIRVLDKAGNTRVKLGNIAPNLYGLRLQNAAGQTTFRSLDSGDLALAGKMYIGSNNAPATEKAATVAIGNLGIENVITQHSGKNRRILVQKNFIGSETDLDTSTEYGPQFIVYDTGDVFIKGTVEADVGVIGGFIIGENQISSSDNTIILSPEKISISGFAVDENKEPILDEDGNPILLPVFSADNKGNLIVNNATATNLLVNNGAFNNITVDSNSVFNGIVNARHGLIKGSLILGDKIPSFTLSSIIALSPTNFQGTVVSSSITNTISANSYYFVQATIGGKEEVFIIKVTNVLTGDSGAAEKINFEFILGYQNSFTATEDSSLVVNSELANQLTSKTFYKVANNNIVLDGATGTIYNIGHFINNNGYILNGNGSIVANNLELGTDNSKITINADGINIRISGGDSIFSVDNNGKLTTNSISIEGNDNNYIRGTLYVGENNRGIKLKSGQISSYSYTNSAGAYGWIVNEDGSAIFNDVTIRGRIQSSTFVQNEIQALSGVLVVRPTLTFKDNSEIIYNSETNRLQGQIYENISNSWRGNYYRIETKDGAIYNFSIENFEEIDGNYLITLRPLNSIIPEVSLLESSVIFTEELLKEFVGLPLINIGNASNYTVGICLNATDLKSDFGFPESITIYDQNAIGNDSDNFVFNRNNRLIMGKLPEEDIIPRDLQGSFGLYADSVYLKGAMISASGSKEDNTYMTSGVNTQEVNGNVFWGGASDDTAESIAAAPFRITHNGELYAEKGIFKGIVDAAEIRTAVLMGRETESHLRIINYPTSSAKITFEQFLRTESTIDSTGNVVNTEDIYSISASLDSQNFRIAAPLSLYSNFSLDYNKIPSLMSFSEKDLIGVKELVSYDLYSKDSLNGVRGWGIRNDSIFYRDITNNEEINQNQYRERILEFSNIDNKLNKFEIAVADNINFNLEGEQKVSLNRQETSFYNNIVMTSLVESNNQRCAFKTVIDFIENQEGVSEEKIIGYNLYIEEI